MTDSPGPSGVLKLKTERLRPGKSDAVAETAIQFLWCGFRTTVTASGKEASSKSASNYETRTRLLRAFCFGPTLKKSHIITVVVIHNEWDRAYFATVGPKSPKSQKACYFEITNPSYDTTARYKICGEYLIWLGKSRQGTPKKTRKETKLAMLRD